MGGSNIAIPVKYWSRCRCQCFKMFEILAAAQSHTANYRPLFCTKNTLGVAEQGVETPPKEENISIAGVNVKGGILRQRSVRLVINS